jgi:hypothetical protein
MLNNRNHKHQISEETRLVINALEGAAKGIVAAVEQESITPTQIECLLSILLKQLIVSLSH